MSETKQRVSITVSFERPQNTSLEDCIMLVMNQMRASPRWDNSAGTGLLNYVCYDHSLEVTSAIIITAAKGE